MWNQLIDVEWHFDTLNISRNHFLQLWKINIRPPWQLRNISRVSIVWDQTRWEEWSRKLIEKFINWYLEVILWKEFRSKTKNTKSQKFKIQKQYWHAKSWYPGYKFVTSKKATVTQSSPWGKLSSLALFMEDFDSRLLGGQNICETKSLDSTHPGECLHSLQAMSPSLLINMLFELRDFNPDGTLIVSELDIWVHGSAGSIRSSQALR